MPNVITANLLRTGAVVYLASDGQWVRDLARAAIANDAPTLAPLEAIARTAVERRDVTAVYVFDVRIDAGRPTPISVRETIRATHALAS